MIPVPTLDLAALGLALGLLALALTAFALHARGWRDDERALPAGSGRRAAPAVSGQRLGIRLLALGCLALAAAAPAWRATLADATAEPILVIVLDVSMSMRAADVAPSRLDEARRQVAMGLAGPFGGRVALVAFAGAPALICPPTTDRAAFEALLEATREDAALPGLSLAAPAVRRAIALSGDGGGDLLLVSDGEFPDADRQQLRDAAREARARGIRISTLGVGTADGAPVPVRDGAAGQVQRDASGQPVISRLDATLLRWLASEGGGQHLDLRPGGSVDLVALTERLRLAGDRSSARLNPFGPVSLYGYPLALGVLLLSLDGWLAWRGGRP